MSLRNKKIKFKTRSLCSLNNNDNNPQLLSDLDRIKYLSQQTLDSSKRIHNICTESKGLGISAALLLDEQDEKLNRLQKI